MFFALLSIISKSALEILLHPIHNFLMIHFAIPRNKLCMGSTTKCLIGSWYGNRSIFDHLTWVSLTWHLLSSSVFCCFHIAALRLCSSTSLVVNQFSMSSKPPKFGL